MCTTLECLISLFLLLPLWTPTRTFVGIRIYFPITAAFSSCQSLGLPPCLHLNALPSHVVCSSNKRCVAESFLFLFILIVIKFKLSLDAKVQIHDQLVMAITNPSILPQPQINPDKPSNTWIDRHGSSNSMFTT